MPRAYVRVLGVALTASACQTPAALPARPLPTWEEVGDGQGEGKTNPPSPVLVVSREPLGCYKGWRAADQPPPPAVRAAGGEVVATPAEVGRATPIQCPPGQPQALLAAWEAPPDPAEPSPP